MLRIIQKKLLPGYFKYIGLLIIFFRIAFLAYRIIFVKDADLSNSIMEQLTSVLFILGLFFVLMARMKHEDEWTKKLRSDAIVEAFLWGSFITIMISLLGLDTEKQAYKISSTTIFGCMLLIAVSDYYWYKLRGKNLNA